MENYRQWMRQYLEETFPDIYKEPLTFERMLNIYMNTYEFRLQQTYFLEKEYPDRELVKDCETVDDVICFLMKEALKCRSFKSDIAIDIESLIDNEENQYMKKYTKYFGFRECGVDHINFVYGRLTNRGTYGEYPYFSLYCLERNKKNNTCKLYKVKYN